MDLGPTFLLSVQPQYFRVDDDHEYDNEKKINLLGINDIPKEELINIAKTIGLEQIKQKSLELIRKEIEHLGKLALAGQV